MTLRSKEKKPRSKPRKDKRSAFAAQRSTAFSEGQKRSDSSLKSLTVVAETHHYAVLDKPALLDSQNSREGRPSVVEWLEKRYGFAGLIHRLDFGTSGLMVCAKNAVAAKELTQAMQNGDINRNYFAIVLGKILPNLGEVSTPVDEKPAVTRYQVLERFNNATLVEVELETGRKHQIRKHFAEIGHPLLGDHLYGKRGAQLLFNRPALHAHRLKVQDMQYESPLPADLEALLTKLRSTRS